MMMMPMTADTQRRCNTGRSADWRVGPVCGSVRKRSTATGNTIKVTMERSYKAMSQRLFKTGKSQPGMLSSAVLTVKRSIGITSRMTPSCTATIQDTAAPVPTDRDRTLDPP